MTSNLKKNNPLVSIIIRSKNEERWIVSCLNAISNQSLKNFEIILVDNNSTDTTLNRVRDNLLYKNKKLKIINFKEKFIPGKAINKGISKSNGEYIVLLSGHCIPINREWLFNLINPLIKNKFNDVVAVYGRQEPLSFSSPLDKRDLAITFGLDRKIQTKDPFFHNANSAFPKKIWKKFKFDELASNIEDRIWGRTLIKNKYKILYEPKASVFHFHGIHHSGDLIRANNIVKIMDEMSESNYKTNSKKDLKNFIAQLRIVAILPIKGESVKLNGKPLIARAIKVLNKSKYLNNIYISTDEKKNIKIAKKLGVNNFIIRPKTLSKETINLAKVYKFTLNKIEQLIGYVDIVFLLEETHPFRDNDLVDSMIEKLIIENLDTVVAAKIENHQIWNKEDAFYFPLANNNFLSRNIKKNKIALAILGAGCATMASNLRSENIFGKKTALHILNNQFSSIEILNDTNYNFNK